MTICVESSNDAHDGGEKVVVRLPNGKVVIVYAVSNDDPRDSVIEVYQHEKAWENGDTSPGLYVQYVV